MVFLCTLGNSPTVDVPNVLDVHTGMSTPNKERKQSGNDPIQEPIVLSDK